MTTSQTGHDITPLGAEARELLAQKLTPEERHILLDHGTEPPFCGGFLAEKGKGTYACRLCELPLYRSDTKFESGTGWPSFHTAYDPAHVREIEDRSHGMRRVEIRCARCDGHLGPMFPDGPKPSGMRHCLNSASLAFLPEA